MDEVTRRLQREAERIASRHPVPEFYIRFKAPIALARKLFFSHPAVLRMRRTVEPLLQEDLGHGIFHTTRVSMDTAALIFIEVEPDGMSFRRTERLMMLGLFAGLLHDIRRSEERHAEAGAMEAEKLLLDFHLSRNEVECICEAIRNHEAFTAPTPCTRPWFQLVSDCLYDADKFRWGADTFTHTLWHMANHQGLSPQELLARFPWGISGTFRIAGTFRTATGRQFGPEIIETGIEIGKEIYRYLYKHFKEDKNDE
jgi:hypothetical protein